MTMSALNYYPFVCEQPLFLTVLPKIIGTPCQAFRDLFYKVFEKQADSFPIVAENMMKQSLASFIFADELQKLLYKAFRGLQLDVGLLIASKDVLYRISILRLQYGRRSYRSTPVPFLVVTDIA